MVVLRLFMPYLGSFSLDNATFHCTESIVGISKGVLMSQVSVPGGGVVWESLVVTSGL